MLGMIIASISSMEIVLTKGATTLISDIDSDLASRRWYLNTNGYAMGYIQGSAKRINKKLIGAKQDTLHSIILTRIAGVRPPNHFADHINRNKLDNRRENLRWVSIKDNSYNHAGPCNSTNFKGVYKLKKYTNKYTASINGKYLGIFNSPEDAAKAYDKAAFDIAGQCAYLNFPQTHANSIQ